MVRHATAEAARRLGWSAQQIETCVYGHDDTKEGQATSDERLWFLRLPSLTPEGVMGIRRVLIMGPRGFDPAPLRRQLNGQELCAEATQRPVAMLSMIGNTDRGVMPFLRESEVWSTVSPVILPGYDDPGRLRDRLQWPQSEEHKQRLQERLDTGWKG